MEIENLPYNNQNLYMSNFWQNYKVIYTHFIKKQKEIMDICYIFNKLTSLIEEFSNGLDNITQYPFKFDDNSSFNKSIIAFIELLKNEVLIIQEYRTCLINIRTKLDDILTSTIFSVKNSTNQRAQIMNEFIFYLNENEVKKKKYHNFVKLALEKKLKLDENNKTKELESLSKLISNAKDSRIEYKNCLKKVNEKRIEYINEISNLLLIFEDKEKSIIDISKQSIINYCNEKMNILQKISKSVKINLEENFNKINSELDIKEFVEKNSSLGSQPIEIPFIEYSIDFPIPGSNMKERNENTKILKNFLIENFSSLDEKDDEIIQIQKICENIWYNRIKNEEINNIISLFSKEINGEKIMNKQISLYFLSYFNKQRTTGQFLIEEITYECLVKCINNFLNLNNSDLYDNTTKTHVCDFEICGLCIILSQTYYKNPIEKIFIQYGIENNIIFKKKEFWFDLASYYIQSNYHEQMKGVTSCIEELDEEDTSRIKTVAFGKVSTILFNMKSFHVPIKLVRELCIKLCKQFDIEKDMINMMWNVNSKNDVNDVIFDIEEKEKKEIDFEKEMKDAENLINKNINNKINNNIDDNIINTDKKK